jgi:hypothetical protein
MDRGNGDYHRLRADQCRRMALKASLPETRRRHEQLAELHARKADEEAEAHA